MPVKTFTFFNLGRDLDNLAPGFGLTMNYDVLESLIRSMPSPHNPPDHLRDELKLLAKKHHCAFSDLPGQRFVHFVKVPH